MYNGQYSVKLTTNGAVDSAEIQAGVSSIELPWCTRELPAGVFAQHEWLTTVTCQQPPPIVPSFALHRLFSLLQCKLPKEWAEMIKASVVLEAVALQRGGTVGPQAFRSCPRLEGVVLPSRCLQLLSNVFDGCSSLKHVQLPPTLSVVGIKAFTGCVSLQSIDLPPTVARIGPGAFDMCSSLETLALPDGITKIDEYTFHGCANLASVSIPRTLRTIRSSAFRGCTNLVSICLPAACDAFHDLVFSLCTSLQSVTMDPCDQEFSVRIGFGAFRWCEKLTTLAIPRGNVSSIGAEAFEKCTALKTVSLCRDNGSDEGVVTFKTSMSQLGTAVFKGCTQLTTVELPVGLTSIGPESFFDCVNLVSVVIPDGVSTISQRAFANCRRLTRVDFPDSVLRIGTEAFMNCSALDDITLPPQLTTIGVAAFQRCTGLSSISLPDSVQTVERYAFSGCTWLTVGSFPIAHSTFQDGPAFVDCPNLVLLYSGATNDDSRGRSPPSVNIIETAVRALWDIRFPDLAGGPMSHDIFQPMSSWYTKTCNRLHFWDPTTHQMCLPATREWVVSVLMIGARQRHKATQKNSNCVGLPDFLWLEILRCLRRSPPDPDDKSPYKSPYTVYYQPSPWWKLGTRCLRYWDSSTHKLCSPTRRRWVLNIFLIAARQRGGNAHGIAGLPDLIWMSILRYVERSKLGRVANS